MLFTGSFKDIDGVKYNVEINSTNETGPAVELTFSSTPCVISTASEGIFSPIKSRSCTLEIVSTDYYKELYDPISRGTTVKIMRVTGPNESIDYTTIFRGYLTPCEYNQDYSYIDTITLEAVDVISATKDYRWEGNDKYNSFLDIILSILKQTGYQGRYDGILYVPRSYTKINNTQVSNSDILSKLYASSNNFIDDDAERTHWTQYEVLEEILKFLGWSLVPFGDDVYLVDYKAINNGSLSFTKYALHDDSNTPKDYIYGDSLGSVSIDYNKEISVEGGDFAAGSSNISIDDIYSKISISDNLYEIENLCPDIFDDGIHISINDENNGIGIAGSKWTNTEIKKFLWWETGRTTEITGYDYQTFCRLNPNSGWTHKYYRHIDGSYIGDSETSPKGYHDNNGDTVYGKWDSYRKPLNINALINTHCCLIQHYAHIKEQGANNIPATIDWTDYLTFFVADNSTGKANVSTQSGYPVTELSTMLEKEVLVYETSESVQWKPYNGTSWITIKGDLWYQYNGATFGDKNKNNLYIINSSSTPPFYTTAPVDKAVNVDSRIYINNCIRHPKNPDYGLGFGLWKMCLQIGDKFWNGEEWIEKTHPNDPDITFMINYNNGPDGSNDETLEAFSWMSAVNTHNYKDKVGVDGYCIPIDYNDNNAPSRGKLRLSIYTPRVIPDEFVTWIQTYFPNAYFSVNWFNFAPIIYCKDFELGYVYTDSNVWYNNHKDESKKDKVYIGYIDDNYVKEFDGIEFKLNTAIKDKPISRSYVTTNNGYLQSLKHRNSSEEKAQEYNVIDQYLDHFSERKIIYETNLKGYFNPLQRMYITQKTDYKSIAGNYIIDTQSFDVAANNNRIKLIEY